MKTTRITYTALLGILLVLSLPSLGNNTTPNERKEIESMCSKIEQAIEHRKFADAKEVISTLMPLLKKDIKDTKKLIASYQKQKVEKSQLELLTEKYKRKVDLYESAKKLVESSPAAIRVKGKSLVTMLNEYNEIGEIVK